MMPSNTYFHRILVLINSHPHRLAAYCIPHSPPPPLPPQLVVFYTHVAKKLLTPFLYYTQRLLTTGEETVDSAFEEKFQVQVYSLISSLKTYHPTLHFFLWSLDMFIRVPFQLHGKHTVLQPFRCIELIVHITISVLPGTHFRLSQVKHLWVPCLRTQSSKQCPKVERRETLYFSKNPAPSGVRKRTTGSDIGKAPRSDHCAMSICNIPREQCPTS